MPERRPGVRKIESVMLVLCNKVCDGHYSSQSYVVVVVVIFVNLFKITCPLISTPTLHSSPVRA